MSRRKYKNRHGHTTVFRARQGENTADTHIATKLDTMFIDTKTGHKYATFLNKLVKKYSDNIANLSFKDDFNERAVAKFQNKTEDSRITSSLNNMAFNVGEQYPPAIIKEKMRIKLMNFGIHWKRGGSPELAIPFLCWYYSEGYLQKPFGFENMKCFKVNINEDTEQVVKLFNRGYTLIECKLSYFEFTEESRKDIIVPNLIPQQHGNYLKTIETAGGNYDSTHFCNIRYNKQKRLIEEVDRRGNSSLGINCSYTLKTRIECIKKGEIRPELYFIGNAIKQEGGL